MQKRSRRSPYMFGVSFKEEISTTRPRFVFQFSHEHGRQEPIKPSPPEERREDQEGQEDNKQKTSNYVDMLYRELEKIRRYLLARGNDEEDRIISSIFNIIYGAVDRKLNSGADPRRLYAMYLDSAKTVKKYFDTVWLRKGHVMPVLSIERVGKKCIAQSTPVKTAMGCTRIYLCHEEGFFDVKGEKLSLEECERGQQKEETAEELFDKFVDTVRQFYTELRGKAISNKDRSIISEIEREFVNDAERLIRKAPNIKEAQKMYTLLVERAIDNVGSAISKALDRAAHLARIAKGKCKYSTSKFSVNNTTLYYEFCDDNMGVLISKPMMIRPGTPGAPPIKIQPIPPIKTPVPAPPLKPPIVIQPQPIRPPEEQVPKPPKSPGTSPRPPSEEVCSTYRGRRICVNQKAGRITVGNQVYRILRWDRIKSYGANEVIYDEKKIDYIRPYMPALGETKKCPYAGRIFFVSGGKIGIAEKTYMTTDNKCHAIFNVPEKTEVAVYFAVPTKPLVTL